MVRNGTTAFPSPLLRLVEQRMVSAILVGAVVGLMVDIAVYRAHGLRGIHELGWDRWMHLQPQLLVNAIAFVLFPVFILNGGWSKRNEWADLWRGLLAILTIGLAMRGIGLFITGSLHGVEDMHLLATGFTATDPIAVTVAIAIVHKPGVVSALLPLFWLLEVESGLNDYIGLVAFSSASGVSTWIILLAVVLTVIAAASLATSDAFGRLVARFWMFHADPQNEKERLAQERKEVIFETAFYLTVLVGMLALAATTHLVIPIGMTVLGGILADIALYMMQKRQAASQEEDPDRLAAYLESLERRQERKQEINEIISLVGTGVIVAIGMSNVDLIGFFSHPETVPVSASLVAAMAVSRALYVYGRLGFLAMRGYHLTMRDVHEANISIMAASTVIGVPAVVSAELYIEGHEELSMIGFETILLSCFLIYPTVKYIKWVDAKYPQQPDTDSAPHGALVFA